MAYGTSVSPGDRLAIRTIDASSSKVEKGQQKAQKQEVEVPLFGPFVQLQAHWDAGSC